MRSVGQRAKPCVYAYYTHQHIHMNHITTCEPKLTGAPLCLGFRVYGLGFRVITTCEPEPTGVPPWAQYKSHSNHNSAQERANYCHQLRE
jgi:hypothetical protein